MHATDQIPNEIPSELPDYDRLLGALEAQDPPERLWEAFEQLDDTLGAIYGVYLSELQYLAADEPQNRAANQIPPLFQQVREALGAVAVALNPLDRSAALEAAPPLREALSALFAAFARMRDQYREGQVYSEAPFTQELLRVAHLYLERRLPLSALLDRFDAFCLYHEQLESTVEQMIPSELEREAFEANRPDLQEALSLQMEGLEELERALDEGDDQAVRESLIALAEAAEALTTVFGQLQSADQSPLTLTCFRCGTENPVENRLCGGCSMVLPKPEQERPLSTLEWKEGGPEQSEPLELQRLREGVEIAVTEGDTTVLERALSPLLARRAAVERKVRQLEAPPTHLPGDQIRILEEAREAFGQTLALFGRGLELLHRALEENRTGELSEGLQLVEEAYSSGQQFSAFVEEAESLQGQGP